MTDPTEADWRIEDKLSTIHASLGDASRACLQIAMKGRVSSGLKDRLIAALRSATETAERL